MNLDQFIATAQHIDPTTGVICVLLGAFGLVISNQVGIESKVRLFKCMLDNCMQFLEEIKRRQSDLFSSINHSQRVVERLSPPDPNDWNLVSMSKRHYQALYESVFSCFDKMNKNYTLLQDHVNEFERSVQNLAQAAEHFSSNIVLLPGLVVSTGIFKMFSYAMAGFGIVLLFTHHKIKDFLGAAAPTPAEMPGLMNLSSIDETILSLLAIFVFMVVLALIITLVSHILMHYHFKNIIRQVKQQ